MGDLEWVAADLPNHKWARGDAEACCGGGYVHGDCQARIHEVNQRPGWATGVDLECGGGSEGDRIAYVG